MTTLADRAAQIKAELLRITPLAIATLPDNDKVLCLIGHPGTSRPDEVMSWRDLSANQAPGPISTNRARDVDYDLTLAVSVFKGGTDRGLEAVAEARAHALITAVEEYVRVTDTTLGGLVFWCFCTALVSAGTSAPEVLAKGRVIEAEAIFSARARITSR